MGIGPSTKETSLHHFRDPLLDVVSSDEDLDLMGIIIVGTPDDNTDKLLVGTRAAVWAEAMRADGVILSSDGWGNSDVDFMDMTVMTEKEDLSAVMDFVKTKDYVDQDHLFLLGQSQGGLVSALTAADRKDDVAAMILIYPAFCIADNAREMYDSAYDIPEDRAAGRNCGF